MERTITDGVAVLALSDPARRNVLSAAMRRQLLAACRAIVEDASPSVRAVVLTGVDGAFSAGGDLADMPPASPEAAAQRLREIRELVEIVSTSRLPWIAAVEGPAAGVACGLAAACDHMVAGRSARFLFPFAKLGLAPDGGALWTIAERVGPHRAKNIFLLANPISAERALSVGLVDEVVDDGSALDRALEVAHDLSSRAPGSVTAIKTYYATGPHTSCAALDFEAQHQVERYFSAELAEGIAAFTERRPANFRPANTTVSSTDVSQELP